MRNRKYLRSHVLAWFLVIKTDPKEQTVTWSSPGAEDKAFRLLIDRALNEKHTTTTCGENTEKLVLE